MARAYKRPESVLVVIHTTPGEVLLVRRTQPVFWQSVTGSLKWPDETPAQAARREVQEETGIVDDVIWRDWHHCEQFPIRPEWAARYGPQATTNIEHLFSAQLPDRVPVVLNPAEHSDHRWCSYAEAIETVWSWTNEQAIKWLAQGTHTPAAGA